MLRPERLPFKAPGRPARAGRVAALAVAAGLLWAWPGDALGQERDATSPADLKRQAEEDRARAQELRQRAADLAEQVRALRSQSVALARRTQQLEAELSRLEATFASLKQREQEKLEALEARREQLADTLAALQRIAIQPPEAVAMSSRSPLDVVRGAMVLSQTVPAIEARAKALRGELADLRQLRREMQRQRTEIAGARDRLESQREKLASVMARKQGLREQMVGRSQEVRDRAETLANKASDMRDLLAKLEAQPEPPAPPPELSRPEPPDTDPETAAEPEGQPDAEAPEARPDAATLEARPDAATADTPAAEPAETAPRPASRNAPPAADTPDASAPARADNGSAAGSGTGSNTGAAPPTPNAKPGEEIRQTARLARPPDIRSFPNARESLRMPASGEIVTRYGEKMQESGGTVAAKGIAIRTRAGARVVAPYDGKVAYAGPFRGYGRILIIEHGDRYHSLLAGLDRIDAIVGQWVLAGEPIGVMTQSPAGAPELYMELRRTGRPINPLPWLAQTGNKVKG